MSNIKINKPRVSGKTHNIIHKAIETMISTSPNKTVLLVTHRKMIEYVLSIINRHYAEYKIQFEYASPSRVMVEFKDSRNGITYILNIEVCSHEVLLYYLKYDFNIFIDDIEFCNILNKDRVFCFSCINECEEDNKPYNLINKIISENDYVKFYYDQENNKVFVLPKSSDKPIKIIFE